MYSQDEMKDMKFLSQIRAYPVENNKYYITWNIVEVARRSKCLSAVEGGVGVSGGV